MAMNPVSPPKAIVYACSGCSDAGELADRIARCFTRDGVAEMSCLAGVGGQVRHLVALARNARRVVVIDGCPIGLRAQNSGACGRDPD